MAYGVGGWVRPGSQVGEHDTGTWHPATRPSHASLGIDDAQAASLVVVLIGVGGWARPGQSRRLQYDTDTWHPAACPIQPG